MSSPKTRTQFRRDSFYKEYVAIINQAGRLVLAVLDVSVEPASQTARARLRLAGREIKRQCNRLAYKLGRKAAPALY